MTEISASLVKELREKSGAGMLDCKKALTETKGDMEAAIDFLRKKGLATAAKKSGRAAAEGLVSVASAGNVGVMVELNAETDFVARNDQFQQYLVKVTQMALGSSFPGDGKGSLDVLLGTKLDGDTVQCALTKLIANIGENMVLRRVRKMQIATGIVSTYVHNAMIPNCGKIGVLVALQSTGDKDKLAALGRQLAMHIAASRPEALDVSGLDKDTVARERAVHADKASKSGKPPEIVAKMVDGAMRKFYEQVVLLEQTFIIDGATKISAVLKNAEKDVGAPVALAAYERFELGEGVEKKADDFAAEVAKMAAG